MMRVWSSRLGEWTTQVDVSKSAEAASMVHAEEADEIAREASPVDAADKESLELLWSDQMDEPVIVRRPLLT